MTSLPPTPKQLEYLRKLGYSGPANELTIRSASQRIEALQPDLRTLDLVGVFRSLNYKVTEVENSRKYWVRCPWANEHSWIHPTDTVIWQDLGAWPTFRCSHNHCADRKLADVIAWAKSIRPGIINDHCFHPLMMADWSFTTCLDATRTVMFEMTSFCARQRPSVLFP
jgi:hypothetical protein